MEPTYAQSRVKEGLGEFVATSDLPRQVRRRLEPLVEKMESRRFLRGEGGTVEVEDSSVEVYPLFRSETDRQIQGYVLVNAVETERNSTVRPQYIVVFNADGVQIGGWKEGRAGFRTDRPS